MKRTELEALDKASLVDLAEKQAARIADLEGRLAGIDAQLEELERRAMRGAAPFARPPEKRSKACKRPGRKGGHDGFFRVRPSEEDVARRIDVPLEQCSACGAALDPTTDVTIEQTLLEIPPITPEIIRLVTHRNHCCGCGARSQSTHPLQISRAQGAASTHLGPRALAVAANLNKGLGLTMRKTCLVLKDLLGLDLSPGGLAQALARLAGRLKSSEQALTKRVMAEPVLHTDETSWYGGEPGASLWVITNAAGTCYRIVPSRTKAAAHDLLGAYQGVLVSDCLNIYDDLTPLQHKCYAHHLKKIGEALAGPAIGSEYLTDLRGLMQGAMALKEAIPGLPPERVAAMRTALEINAERLLGPSRAGVEERIRLRIAKQRDHLFTFLDHSDVHATNNLAERQLRPAVISRKLSCGNKTEAGARTWETLTSLAVSSRQNGTSFIELVANALTAHTEPTR